MEKIAIKKTKLEDHPHLPLEVLGKVQAMNSEQLFGAILAIATAFVEVTAEPPDDETKMVLALTSARQILEIWAEGSDTNNRFPTTWEPML